MSKGAGDKDIHTQMIELTAEETDKLSAMFHSLQESLSKVISLAEETKVSVNDLKTKQEEVIQEQTNQSEKLKKIDGAIASITIKMDEVTAGIDEIRQAVGGAVGLAATAFKEATGHEINQPRLKKVSSTNR